MPGVSCYLSFLVFHVSCNSYILAFRWISVVRRIPFSPRSLAPEKRDSNIVRTVSSLFKIFVDAIQY